jgi:hypothetical protein
VNTNVNLSAALGVLGFLGTALVLFLLGLVALHALAVKRYGRLKVSVAGMGLVSAAYLGVLVAFSVASGGRVLARGEEKHFCEIDCHLAYSVAGVRRAKTLGAGASQTAARGEFYVVTLRTRFDETTVGPRRGDSPLYPNPRRATVYDDAGRAYEVSDEGRRALASGGGTGIPLDTPLRPGESYATELVFDLPPDARAPLRLLLNESSPETRFIIGHENSPLHRKTEFGL